MFLELIATVVAALAAAGLVLALNKLSGGRLPRWLMPAAAGIAMFAFTIWMEYDWFDRTSGGLPEGAQVLSSVEQKGGLRVWTHAFPYIKRFAATDPRSKLTNPQNPDQHIVNIMLLGRWQTPSQVPVLVDCAQNRTSDLPPDAEFGADGQLVDATWRALGADDPLLSAICKEG